MQFRKMPGAANEQTAHDAATVAPAKKIQFVEQMAERILTGKSGGDSSSAA